jgi:putative glutathione S-transferase
MTSGHEGAGPELRGQSRIPDCTPDTVNGFHYLHQAYVATDSRYTGRVTVPALWDRKTKRIVSNESSETGIIPKGTPVDYAGPHDGARLAA